MYKTVRIGGFTLILGVDRSGGERTATSLESHIVKPPAHKPLNASPSDSPERKKLIEQIRQVDEWYHAIELPYGLVTPGGFDHRPVLKLYGLPESLVGKRVLEIATYDGFWSFECERRGAASVTCIDVERFSDPDIPPPIRRAMRETGQDARTGRGFEIAKAALGSKVERKLMSVYHLSPETLGTFDLVFCGDLLLHLRDPMLALQNIYSVTRGIAIIVDVVDPQLNVPWDVIRYMGGYEDCVWWFFKPDTLKRMVRDAGFARVEAINLVRLDFTNGQTGPWRLVLHAYTNRGGSSVGDY